jgi:hypothetical protein
VVNILQPGEFILQFPDLSREELNVGLLNLRLLTLLIEEKCFLPDLDIVAEKKCDRDLKKNEETSSDSNTFLFHLQGSHSESGVAKDENINIIFFHREILVSFVEVCFP